MSKRSTIATAAASSALSLTLLTALQKEAQAQNPFQRQNNVQRPGQQQFTDQQRQLKFFNNGFTWCDAMILAAFWDGAQNEWDAKMAFGQALLEGDVNQNLPGAYRQLQDIIVGPRAEALRLTDNNLPNYVELSGNSYNYDDADALAALWGELVDE